VRATLSVLVLMSFACGAPQSARGERVDRVVITAQAKQPAVVEPREAATSEPAGLDSLSASERAALERPACAAEIRAIARRARNPSAVFDAVASHQPRTACIELATRDLRTALARSIEAEAMAALRAIASSMRQGGDGWSRRGAQAVTLCPSAPPIPRDLQSLRAGPARIAAGELTGGWTCANLPFVQDAVRYQYEIRTAPDGRSSEILARGFPVRDRTTPEELFVRVVVDNDADPIVYRR
jgi:hypothetical protein